MDTSTEHALDIAPFALPNCAPGELYFEEPRDILSVEIISPQLGAKRRVSYRQHIWPASMWYEDNADMANPARFGWMPIDDHFNGRWAEAKVSAEPLADGGGTRYTFAPLGDEGYEIGESRASVRFRRTVGIKVDPWESGDEVRAYTTSKVKTHTICVEVPRGSYRISAYNVVLEGISPGEGCSSDGGTITCSADRGTLTVSVRHMCPTHRYAGDTGLLSVEVLDADDAVTVSIEDLVTEPGIWNPTHRLYFSVSEGSPLSLDEYRKRCEGAESVSGRIARSSEQSFAGAFYGQPRPHAVHAHVGVKHARQRFLLEPNGDIVLDARCLWKVEGGLDREAVFKNASSGRFFFGLESWISRARYRDSSRAPMFIIESRRGDIVVEETTFAVPIERAMSAPQRTSDEPIAAVAHFRFSNQGASPETAQLSLAYSSDSGRSTNALYFSGNQSDYLIPGHKDEPLAAENSRITGTYRMETVLRARYSSDMSAESIGGRGPSELRFSRELGAGEHCELTLLIPFVVLTDEQEALLASIDPVSAREAVRAFWRDELGRGARIRTPVPHLDALHETHLSHVLISDFPMPQNPELINTSVGTSTYGNFSNESCMIVQELTQRGLFDDARKRLDLWIAYQGTVQQPGNFVDFSGMYFGAGGFEQGHYNQHHGWVLWCIAEYYLLSRDDRWFKTVADSVVKACDWVFRQRKTTTTELPHSRGWERGYLPAGSLEDVEEFHYWLSTNALTWRGTDHAARALERIEHREAQRIRRASDAYRNDLKLGFEQARKASPLVKLATGDWVPTYPSRLYCRGRDYGWIREVLEGSIYLLISGLYDADSEEAGWILDDFQDNRYLRPPNGYLLRDPDHLARHRGGFSIQPTLLAGLMPHLARDEPEVYLWMFFNAFCACYREEIEGFSEHPMPELGFSNSAEFKTSDEANAVMWLRYLFAYSDHELLHIGRAMPRAWLGLQGAWSLTGLETYHGSIDITYLPNPSDDSITLRVRRQSAGPEHVTLARFRHPRGEPISSVTVNGKEWTRFDARKNDVDISGLDGEITVVARFQERPRQA